MLDKIGLQFLKRILYVMETMREDELIKPKKGNTKAMKLMLQKIGQQA